MRAARVRGTELVGMAGGALPVGAASAPLVLAWIVLRGHALSWARGERRSSEAERPRKPPGTI